MIVRRLVEGTQVRVRGGSGEGFDRQEEDQGWIPHGYQIPSTRAILAPRTVIRGQDDRYRLTP